MIRRLTLILITLLLVSSLANAAKSEIYASTFGGAISGYDPVAYFTEGKPVEGKRDHSLKYKGETWRFSSEKNKQAFQKSPQKYAPQYGGYCAYAVSKGYTASTDPDAWTIVNGKLYLNYSKSVQAKWSKDKPGNIRKANANWPKVLK